MLRQADNTVEIVGILSEIKLDNRKFTKNGLEKNAIGGSIKVKVLQKINGVNTTLEVPVHFFSTQFTINGDVNKVYENLKKFKDEAVSIAAAGAEDSADWVRIRGAKIAMNDFATRDGRIISTPQISGAFIQRIAKPEDNKSYATFSLEFMVAKKEYEIKNDKETGRYEIKAAVPMYAGKVDLIPLIASSENVINAIESYWEEGQTYTCAGVLNFSAKTEITTIPVDFGDPIEKEKTISVSELIVTSGTQSPADEMSAFSQDEMKEALKERKARLEKIKTEGNKQKPKAAPASSSNGFDLGF